MHERHESHERSESQRRRARALMFPTRSRGVLATCAAVVLAVIAAFLVAPALGEPTRAQVWVTTADGRKKLERGADATFGGDRKPTDISIDAQSKAQRFTGAGASVTESSAHLLSRLPASRRTALLRDLFASGGGGIGLDYLRQPLGGTDYVSQLPYYSYEDTRGRFSLGRDRKEILPVLNEAKGINPDLRFMGTPWSPPGWMKEGGKLAGGRLSPRHYGDYADYLVRALQAYRRAGIPLHDLTVQNEPQLTATYPSAEMSADAQAHFLEVLDGRLSAAGLDTTLFAYDHNWDNPGYAQRVLRRTEDVRRVQGAAFHCYAGKPEAQQQVREDGKRVLETECSGRDSGDPARTFADTLAWQTGHLVIRGLRAGSETAVLWNLALDGNGGPHFGGCGTDCHGVVEVDGDRVRKNAGFYVLGHVSKFVDRGARRVSSTSQGDGGIQNVTFVNPDGSRSSVVLNSADSARTFSLTENGTSLSYELPAGAVATFDWSGPPRG